MAIPYRTRIIAGIVWASQRPLSAAREDLEEMDTIIDDADNDNDFVCVCVWSVALVATVHFVGRVYNLFTMFDNSFLLASKREMMVEDQFVE